jgi:hypothetical protein
METFKEQMRQAHQSVRGKDLKAYVKRINYKIDGFGNYYKHGDVAKQFEVLDAYIRGLVRERLKHDTGRYAVNSVMERVGLHSLMKIYGKHASNRKNRKRRRT